MVPLSERLEIVASITYVDRAVAEIHANRLDSWAELHFDVFFKGDDWRGTPAALELESRFAAVGVAVEYFPYTLNTSSTILRHSLALLDAPFAGGTVVRTGQP